MVTHLGRADLLMEGMEGIVVPRRIALSCGKGEVSTASVGGGNEILLTFDNTQCLQHSIDEENAA